MCMDSKKSELDLDNCNIPLATLDLILTRTGMSRIMVFLDSCQQGVDVGHGPESVPAPNIRTLGERGPGNLVEDAAYQIASMSEGIALFTARFLVYATTLFDRMNAALLEN